MPIITEDNRRSSLTYQDMTSSRKYTQTITSKYEEKNAENSLTLVEKRRRYDERTISRDEENDRKMKRRTDTPPKREREAHKIMKKDKKIT